MIRLLSVALLATSACASTRAPRNITAVEVALVPFNGSPGAAKAVPAGELAAWSTCLAGLKSIQVDELIKAVLVEGAYRLDVADEAGKRSLTLHNSQDLSEGGAYYRSDCAYALVTGLMGTAAEAVSR